LIVFLDASNGYSVDECIFHNRYITRNRKETEDKMDRGHGATYAGSDNHLFEYWEEYQKMIEETKMLDDYLDEECSPRSYDGLLLIYHSSYYELSRMY